MKNVRHFFLGAEGAKYEASENLRINNKTGPLKLMHEVDFHPRAIRKDLPGLWRYLPFLPLMETSIRTLGEGMTPILDWAIDGIQVRIKAEHLAPSGSYKDRGSAVLMAYCREWNVQEVVQDSSGNAGASIAAYAALHNIACTILVPEATAQAKLLQMERYGARVNRVHGNREQTAKAALELADNLYYASHCYHPVFYEGTKTFAYEIAEQSNWNVPDSLILPAGNGTLLLGAFIGFNEMFRSGVIDRIPRLIAVQTEVCTPLFSLWSGNNFSGNKGTGLAEGIAIAEPVRLKEMLHCVNETGGMVLTVSESEIKSAWHFCSRQGHYIEPTSAAVISGLKRYLNNHICPGEQVMGVFTGHGLKKA